MNKSILLILLLAGCTGREAKGQTVWRQVRKMSYNGTVDEWRRQGDTMAVPKDTIRIHDTVYLPKAQYDSIFPRRAESLGLILSSGPITMSSGSSWFDIGSGRLRHRRKKKQRIAKIKQYEASSHYYTPCSPDTVRGVLVYNNGEIEAQGNTYTSGYWVGCGCIYFHVGPQTFIYGRNKKTELYVDTASLSIKKRTIGEYAGSFYTDEGDKIPNYLVYQLILNQ